MIGYRIKTRKQIRCDGLWEFTFLSMQSDSVLQEPWLITEGERSECALSCHTQAASDDVNTHL